ncbi:MAG: Uma2 family endonuclease [Polyangiales bacterium]
MAGRRRTATESASSRPQARKIVRAPADDRWWWELWERLDEVPETAVGEIAGGKIRVLPRPGGLHAWVAAHLGDMLVGPFGRGRAGPGGWVILPGPPIRFGDDMRVPDLAGWREDEFRMSEREPFETAPSWVCEILSPSTASVDRAEKMPLYGAHGVTHAWLLDPDARTLEVYRREGDVWVVATVLADDARAGVEPFHAIELDLSELWFERTE